MPKITTKNEKETLAFAKKLAASLEGGDVLALAGNLGAGKTVFTKGVASYFGVRQTVNSPTFVVMKIYKTGKNAEKIQKICHIDAYRLSGGDDLAAIGAGEYFTDQNAVTIIEWADKIKKILPQRTKFIKFKIYKDSRTISF